MNSNYNNFLPNNNINNVLISEKINLGLDSNSKQINMDKNPFKVKLKPHQCALLYKVLDIDDKCSNSHMPFGLLSDKPGSGKTYVVLALIYYAIKFFNSTGVNIIIVPHNIFSQWISSIKKLLGNKLTYKALLEYNDINLLYTQPEILRDNNIIITTSLYYDVLATTLKSINHTVRRVFFDEADTIANLLAHSLPAQMTWFISASIHRIFDTKTQIATIGAYKLNLLDLKQRDCYCKHEFIDANIILESPDIQFFKCKDYYIDKILPFVLNKEQIKYINAHDYSNIRPMLNNANIKCTRDIVENLYKIAYVKVYDYDSQIKDLEKKFKFANQTDKPGYADSIGKIQKLRENELTLVTQLKEIAKEFSLCIKCFNNIRTNTNPDNFKNTVEFYQTECEEYVCSVCVENEIASNPLEPDRNKIKIKCLTCKTPHILSTLKINSEVIIQPNPLDNINKLTILDKIIEICGSKTIIYSEFRGAASMVKSIISIKNYKYMELDGGNIKDLDTIFDSFKQDPDIKILLIDNASFGVGINIEYATDIIFFNKTEHSMKEQIIGRAQRFGRTNKLQVWELGYKNEFE
jgi:hypothetical protein